MSSISRRSFLKASAVVAGTSALSQALAAGSNERIRIGVIGCRNRGWQIAQSFISTGRFDVVTMADCDRAMFPVAADRIDRLERKPPRPPVFEQDFRKLIDDDTLDAIAIATPDHWHALMTVMALEAGRHVYLEKPASFDINDGKAMVAAQKRHPRLVCGMGTQQRSAGHFISAKQFIDDGGLGKIAFGRAWLSGGRVVVNKVPDTEPPDTLDYDMWVGPAPYHPYNPEKVHYNWHFVRDYGTNDAGNWGAHYLDIVRWFADLDLPTSAASSGGKYVVQDEKEWFDTQTTLFQYPKMTVVWEMRHWASTGVESMGTGAELRGEKGTILIDREAWTFYPKAGEPVRHPGSTPTEPLVENFADAIAGGAKLAAPIEEGHKTAILCHLANISTLYGRTINFDPKRQEITGDAEAAKMMGREYRKQWPMPV